MFRISAVSSFGPASRRAVASLAFVFLAVLAPSGNASAASLENHAVIVEQGVLATMRDGVKLHADLYRPDDPGNFPVLLVRTPYDRKGEAVFAMKAAARGYLVVAQDVRGRYESEGLWYPFLNESQDGFDTVEWAAALPRSNGKVAMFGGSYVGATQFLAAIAKPPHLAGICPNVTASNYHDGWTYQSGAFEQWFNESWTTGLAENTMYRKVERASSAVAWTPTLPLTSYPILAAANPDGIAPYFSDWLAHPNYDEYWKRWSIEDHYADIQVPVFNLAAWYDIFLGGSLRNYMRLKKEGGTPAARNNQRLMVFVGGHAGDPAARKVGAVDFGEKLPVDMSEVMLRWYDHLLKSLPNGVEQEKPVRIFVMGANEWRDVEDWPPPAARTTRYFLHSDGAAAGAQGSGTLTTASPAGEKPDRYLYDPNNPAPTIGGPLCCGTYPTGPGPQDQKSTESRPDVLVFTTPPMSSDLEVTGPVTLDLFVSTSAVDTDFTGKLVDLAPDGFAQNLTEGILRLRYRNSQEKPELAKPGDTYHITLDLWATSNVFRVGHRLRLEISSSNFPRFDRNLNTGEDQARSARMLKATNVIFHDKAHPSALLLPVMP